VARFDLDRQTEPLEPGVGQYPVLPGHRLSRSGDQHSRSLVHLLDGCRVSGVEGRGEDGRVLHRVRGEGHPVRVAGCDLAHVDRERGPDAAHQTVSADGWDLDLVPDEAGRTAKPEPTCPVEVALAAIAGRWTTLLLRDLMGGPRSFGE